MLKLQSVTVAANIHDKLIAALGRADRYMSSTGRQFTSFLDELNTLAKVDATTRSMLMVLLHTLCGDRGQAEYYIDNSRKLHASGFHLVLFNFTMLVNLGYFSEAGVMMHQFKKPEDGVPRLLLDKPPCNGFFHTVLSMFNKANEMKISNLPELPVEVPQAVAIMDQWGDSDADYGAALDIAGTIMRERHLFFQDDAIAIPVKAPADGGAPYVKLSFKVAVDLDTSIEMTCDYAERLAKSGLKIPQSLFFEFEGTR